MMVVFNFPLSLLLEEVIYHHFSKSLSSEKWIPLIAMVKKTLKSMLFPSVWGMYIDHVRREDLSAQDTNLQR